MKFIPEHGIWFEFTSRTDPRYVKIRKQHYVKMRRKVPAEIGRQIQFLVWRRDNYEPIGIITAGSAAFQIAPRDQSFGVTDENRERLIQRIVNNTICRMEVHEKGLMQRVLSIWRRIIPYVWFDLYSDDVLGFETLVEEDEIKHEDGTVEKRDGHNYKGDNWTRLEGKTKGSAKRHSGIENKHTRESTTEKLIYVKKGEDYTWMHKYVNHYPKSQGMRTMTLYALTPHGARRMGGTTTPVKSSWRGTTPEEKQRAKWLQKRRRYLTGACYFLCRPSWGSKRLRVFICEKKNIAANLQ
jgi:hypothetical protein